MLDKMKRDSEFVCSLCGQKEVGFGHNPEPLKGFDERCCTMCNTMKVIPARLHNVFMLQTKPKEEPKQPEEWKQPDDYFIDEEAPTTPLWSLSDDPYYNLLGALHDLEHGVNDQIVRDTINRVLAQIKPKRLKP